MRPKNGVNTIEERHNVEQELEQEQLLACPTRPLNTGFSCNETSSRLHTRVTEKLQRNSVFGRLRSASSTSRSYPSSLNEDSESASRQGPGEFRHGPKSTSSDRPEGAAKSILSRGGKMLRRHGSKFSLSSFILDEESERSSLEISETCQRAQHCPIRSDLLGRDLRNAISPPFDFHHVTHTQARQFGSLDRGSQNELITEFIAIRAAQRPRSTLQGIQADDLRGIQKGKQLDGQPGRHQVRDRSISGSPSTRPNIAASARDSSITHARSKSMRSSVSIENFSRPAPWSVMSPTLSPPRKSSRNALDSPPLPKPLTTKCAERLNDQVSSNIKSDANPEVPHTPTAPPTNVVHKPARSLENWPLPILPADAKSESIRGASTKPEHSIATETNASTSQLIRHTCSLLNPRILSQDGREPVSNDHQQTMKKRPESLQPTRSGQFENVDRRTKYTTRASGKLDWGQKTIYVDADLEPANKLALEATYVERGSLSKDGAPSVDNRQSEITPSSLRQFRVPKLPKLQSPDRYKKSVTELEGCLSPFGRHQSASEFRGYQHCPKRLSDPINHVYIDADNETAPIKEVYDFVDAELPMDSHVASGRCHSEESSSFRAVRPLQHKYSSDGSVLSYITSTTPTNRSSNSFGSVPDLIHSPDSTQESVMAEKPSPTDSVNSGPNQIPPQRTPSLRSEVGPQGSNVQSSAGSYLSRANSLRDPTKQIPRSSPMASVKLAGPSHQSVCDQKKEDVAQTRSAALPGRKRSASAVTPGQRLTVRASYSLFPPQPSSPRLP